MLTPKVAYLFVDGKMVKSRGTLGARATGMWERTLNLRRLAHPALVQGHL
jgi:hypothetical protein